MKMEIYNIGKVVRRFIRAMVPGCLVFWAGSLSAQTTLVNNGADIVVLPNTHVNVAGSVVLQNLGTIDNSGNIMLTGTWTNNAGNTGLVNSSPGEVEMAGAAQLIDGTSITQFYDLNLTGTGVKSLGTDARVEGTLSLNDRQLSTDIHTMFVTNPLIGSVTRTTGYVSSLGAGALSRATNSAGPYLFPVGSSLGTTRYRPVELTPGAGSLHTFTVRLANNDAGTDGYPLTNNDGSVCNLNPDFYHLIGRTSGTTAAGVSIFFDSLADAAYDGIAHWQNTPRWENTGTVTSVYVASPALSKITKAAWNNFSPLPFILANTASASAAFTSSPSGLSVNFTDGSTGSPISWAWNFGDGGNSSQQNPSHTYSANGSYQVCLTVTDAGGCSNTFCDSVTVIGVGIENEGIFSDLTVWPNPTEDRLFIQGNLPFATDLSFSLSDMSGRIVLSRELTAYQSEMLEISTRDMASGMYFLRLRAGNSQKMVQVAIRH